MYIYIYIYICMCMYIYIYIYIYTHVRGGAERAGFRTPISEPVAAWTTTLRKARNRRHINGVVSNGVVPKSQIGKLASKPAPEICIGSCFVPGCFTRQTSKV